MEGGSKADNPRRARRHRRRSARGNHGRHMARRRRPELVAEAARLNQALLAGAGGELRRSRKQRRVTQRQLGAMVGVSQSTISRMERGRGGSISVDAWQRAFLAVDRQLILTASRDPASEPADAGHLRIQEFVLGLGRSTGYAASFELQTRPADLSRSADVGLRDDARRKLLIIECWNTIGDHRRSVAEHITQGGRSRGARYRARWRSAAHRTRLLGRPGDGTESGVARDLSGDLRGALSRVE